MRLLQSRPRSLALLRARGVEEPELASLIQSIEGKLGSALTEAMLGFADHRVPELFSGDSRGDRLFPTPYPVASRPQAWSAASLPWLLMSMGSSSRRFLARLTLVEKR